MENNILLESRLIVVECDAYSLPPTVALVVVSGNITK